MVASFIIQVLDFNMGQTDVVDKCFSRVDFKRSVDSVVQLSSPKTSVMLSSAETAETHTINIRKKPSIKK